MMRGNMVVVLAAAMLLLAFVSGAQGYGVVQTVHNGTTCSDALYNTRVFNPTKQCIPIFGKTPSSYSASCDNGVFKLDVWEGNMQCMDRSIVGTSFKTTSYARCTPLKGREPPSSLSHACENGNFYSLILAPRTGDCPANKKFEGSVLSLLEVSAGPVGDCMLITTGPRNEKSAVEIIKVDGSDVTLKFYNRESCGYPSFETEDLTVKVGECFKSPYSSFQLMVQESGKEIPGLPYVRTIVDPNNPGEVRREVIFNNPNHGHSTAASFGFLFATFVAVLFAMF